MAKAKYANTSRMTGSNSDTINVQQNVDITESVDELIDPDLLLRSFGISDEFVDHMTEMYNQSDLQNSKPQVGGGGIMNRNPSNPEISSGQQQQQQTLTLTNPSHLPNQFFTVTANNPPSSNQQFMMNSSTPMTLCQRGGDGGMVEPRPPKDYQVTLPLETLQNLLSQQNISYRQADREVLCQQSPEINISQQRKRAHNSFSQQESSQQQMNEDMKFDDIVSQLFSVPSPVALSPIYVEQKPINLNGSDDLVTQTHMMSPRTTPRPSPASTPPFISMENQRDREYKKRNDSSGRCTPIGKRSRPQTPTSDCDSDSGNFRDREPLSWSSTTGRMTPTEIKPNIRLEDLVDEDKYNKRKRSTSGGPQNSDGKKKDPLKMMLEQLQSHIPHIGNPDEEKVSHAGLLVEGSDYIRSLMRENNTTKENVEALKLKIEQLNAEIEDFQQKLPEHGSNSIHRIVSSRGKSIPDMYADHVRQRTQSDWRYWVFTSIMGHFVHSFAQNVSNISHTEMENTALDWLTEKISLQQLRKDAFRKLAKLCSKTSIMEDPSKLPGEARSFVALTDTEPPETQAESDSYGGKF